MSNSTAQALRVSYWSIKNTATTGWPDDRWTRGEHQRCRELGDDVDDPAPTCQVSNARSLRTLLA